MNRERIASMLEAYHRCVGVLNKGCRKLEYSFKELGQPLSWANQWVHHRECDNCDRVGVLFFDMLQNKQRWISVPISVFENDEFDVFVRKYCKVDEQSEG
jgi:hypothetical protein